MPQVTIISTLSKVKKLLTPLTFTADTLYDTDLEPHVYAAFVSDEPMIYNDERVNEGFGLIDYRDQYVNVYYNEQDGTLVIDGDNSANYSINGNTGQLQYTT